MSFRVRGYIYFRGHSIQLSKGLRARYCSGDVGSKNFLTSAVMAGRSILKSTTEQCSLYFHVTSNILTTFALLRVPEFK